MIQCLNSYTTYTNVLKRQLNILACTTYSASFLSRPHNGILIRLRCPCITWIVFLPFKNGQKLTKFCRLRMVRNLLNHCHWPLERAGNPPTPAAISRTQAPQWRFASDNAWCPVRWCKRPG